MNRIARWVKMREQDKCQLTFCNGREPIGHVALETGGTTPGRVGLGQSRDAPYVDMRFDNGGYEACEAEAKVRVVEAYEELLTRAAEAALDRQHGRI